MKNLSALAARVVFLAIPISAILSGCTERKSALYTSVPESKSGIDFRNEVTENEEINILTYEYAYNGGGVAAADFNNDGLSDLYFTGNMVGNRLYLNKGNLQFADATADAGVAGRSMWKTGVSVVDINADGWLDLYVCYSGFDKPGALSNELYVNQGCKPGGIPLFKESAKAYGLDAPGTFSTQSAFFDYDRDGDLDMFLINHGNHFYAPFFNTTQLRNTRHPQFGNKLYRNDTADSGMYFHDVSEQAGIKGGGLNFSLGLSVADFNNDGWPDVFVTSDYEEQDFLYLNKGDGTFDERAKSAMGHFSRNGMGCDAADINHDGWLDLIELDMLPEDNYRQKLLKGPDDHNRYHLMIDSGYHYQQMRNTLQLHAGVKGGVPMFAEIGQMAKVSTTDWSWAPLFLDADNDGYEDLFITNGYLRDFTSMDFLKYQVPRARLEAQSKGKDLKMFDLVRQMTSTRTSDYIFRNNGDLTFADKTQEWGISKPNLSFGAAYADLDNDGDLEIITNNTNEPATVWENHANELVQGNFLRVVLKGNAPNSFGYGARVSLWSESGDTLLQVKEMMPSRGYQSSVEPVIHFGLGIRKRIARVQVQWPDGTSSSVSGIDANQTVRINQAGAAGLAPVGEKSLDYLKEIALTGDWKMHRENPFVDFDSEPLIPYAYSRSGPVLAAADVNGDKNEDFFVGGSAAAPSHLLLNWGGGRFEDSDQQSWSKQIPMEVSDAMFFDVDSDGDQDLFVVGGGSEFPEGSDSYTDRLYLNNGKGKFTEASPGSIILDHVSGSCVAGADFDKDGDIDLFVGGGVKPGSFPQSSPSALLRNDTDNHGAVHFTLVTKELGGDQLREAGLTTDAVWTDLDGNGWQDLVIAGHWMPVTVYLNNQGRLTKSTEPSLAELSGLWNTIFAGDLDSDGDDDLIAGNAGLNTSWTASAAEPVEMYYADFNRDGKMDPVICSYVQGTSYPVATRDELLGQLTHLRKKFTDYASYAKATLSDVLTGEELALAQKRVVNTLQSVYLENNGRGGFNVVSLPSRAQFSWTSSLLSLDIDDDKDMDLLVGGNFNPWRTAYGPSDANFGVLLKGNGKGGWEAESQAHTSYFGEGDVRSMIKISDGSGRSYVVVGRNAQAVRVFELRHGMGK